jgi:putative transposase
VVKIASDSDGRVYGGAELKGVRFRNRRLRTKLQKKQTRAAKRRLKKLSGREARFARHVNHVISKEIVASAERTGRGIAVEELTGIRERIRAGRKQRAVLHSWAFAQPGAFLSYKAILAGVPLVAVDPGNTSQECAACGCIDKRNRPDQPTFRCVACRHAANADTNAARVIAGRATCKLAVNAAGCAEIGSHSSVTSRCL